MAKDKERTVNPAQQARKQEKNRALKKAKTEQQARRNEKLARRNPDRLQRQIEDLKALESSGEIKPREKAILADLERDLRAVTKAREALGEKAPTFGNAQLRRDRGNATSSGDKTRSDGQGILGKRGRDGERRSNQRYNHNDDRENSEDSGEETDASVRNIPMPRDTPPPIPPEFRRKNNRQNNHRYHNHHHQQEDDPESRHAPTIEQKTTYSSAPQIRDLRKEATSRFVPSAVKMKQNAVKGVGGGLLEPEELDRLEAAGYYKNNEVEKEGQSRQVRRDEKNDADDDDDGDDAADAAVRRLAEEEARFQRELADVGEMDVDAPENQDSRSNPGTGHPPRPYQVEIEEVDDEDL